jgi:CRISPR/Cas system CMR-associated protein Cmr1 (group 7 of RAMP superfamily)
MKDYNDEMYKLLRNKKNRKFWKETQKLEDLYYHLELWLKKYKALKNKKDISLIFVGLEEGRPFPAGIDDDVRDRVHRQ